VNQHLVDDAFKRWKKQGVRLEDGLRDSEIQEGSYLCALLRLQIRAVAPELEECGFFLGQADEVLSLEGDLIWVEGEPHLLSAFH